MVNGNAASIGLTRARVGKIVRDGADRKGAGGDARESSVSLTSPLLLCKRQVVVLLTDAMFPGAAVKKPPPVPFMTRLYGYGQVVNSFVLLSVSPLSSASTVRVAGAGAPPVSAEL